MGWWPVFLGCVMAMGVVPRAGADIWFVDAAATGASDGSSWADAMTSLRAAVMASGDGDGIWVARGMYFATDSNDPNEVLAIPANVKVFGGFAGGEMSPAERAADSDPATADPAEDTIISGELGGPGSADNSRRLVFITGPNERVVLDRLVLRGAANVAPGGAVQIFGFSDQPTLLRDCLIVGNAATMGGGVNVTTGRLTAERCIFRDNAATLTDVRGGAVAMTSSIGEFTSCVFESNRAVSGAAALEAEATTLTVTSCEFRDNTCSARAFGGAMRIGGGAPARAVTITGCRFVENGGNTLPPEECLGGAVRIDANTVTISDCEFIGNYAETGGAVSVRGGTNLIKDSRFDQNTAVYGGALSMVVQSANVTTLTGCDFTRGTAIGGGGGGGGAVFCGAGKSVFEECWFVENESVLGGAMLITSGVCLATDCSFRRNSADAGGAVYVWDPSDERPQNEFTRCIFGENTAVKLGGGAVASEISASVRLYGCAVFGNTAAGFGGGLISRGTGLLRAVNCTIVGNSATVTGGARGVVGGLTVVNSIVRGNYGGQIEGALGVSYSNVEGGAFGDANIDAPVFFAGVNDFRLLAGSGGIDAGVNSAIPLTITHDIHGTARRIDDPGTPDTGFGTAPIIDMGAFEFDPAAPPACGGDTNGDGLVNGADLSVILSGFGALTIPGDGGDLNGDGVLDGADLSVLLFRFGTSC